MTIVEIYDEEVVNNICASLKFNNEKIIYIGYDKREMERGVENINKFFALIGRNIKISCIYVCKNNLMNMLEEISKILEINNDNEEYIFDITGGDDLILVAMGIIAERYHIDMFTTNLKGKVIWQTDNEKQYILRDGRSEISVRENIVLHGGDVVGPNNQKGIYTEWTFDNEFVNDINLMWEICRIDCMRWNREIGEIQQKANKIDNIIPGVLNKTMQELIGGGILVKDSNYKNDIYCFKNKQIREALMKVGNILELYTCITAIQMINENGNKHFQDVRVSVNIDWDGVIHDIHDDEKDTRNEIDVMMMKGMIPIFISCKNGDVGIEELYKLNTVAEKFGGKHVKKVLIATYFGKKGASQKYFMQRAKDMRILVIGEVHNMTKDAFVKLLANI